MRSERCGQFWETHRVAAQAEDVAFLMEAGDSLEQACARAGVEVEAYLKRQERAA